MENLSGCIGLTSERIKKGGDRMKVICAWCDKIIKHKKIKDYLSFQYLWRLMKRLRKHGSPEPVSHGICEICRDKMLTTSYFSGGKS